MAEPTLEQLYDALRDQHAGFALNRGAGGAGGGVVTDQDTWTNIGALPSPTKGDNYQLTDATGAPARPDGTPAGVGDVVSYSGSAWLNLGPGAIQGSTGPQGPQGDPGPQGTPGTVSGPITKTITVDGQPKQAWLIQADGFRRSSTSGQPNTSGVGTGGTASLAGYGAHVEVDISSVNVGAGTLDASNYWRIRYIKYERGTGTPVTEYQTIPLPGPSQVTSHFLTYTVRANENVGYMLVDAQKVGSASPSLTGMLSFVYVWAFEDS